MNLGHIPRAVLGLAVALALFVPTAAFAAPATWQAIDVIAHDEGSAAVILVTGTLPNAVKLPAEVELAIPAGSKIQWAGEILGGDPAQDPAVEYKVATKGELDVYTFTLTKARIGQIEVLSSSIFSAGNGVTNSSLSWTNHVDVAAFSIYTRVPQSAQIIQAADGAVLEQGSGGYSYYGRVLKDVKANTPTTIDFSFKASAAAPAGGAAAGSDNSTFVLFVLFGLVAGGGFFFIRAINRKMRLRTATEPEPARVSTASKSASVKSAERNDETPDADEGPAVSRRVNPALIISGVVIAGIVIAGFMASGTSSDVQVLPDGFAQEFAAGDACGTLTLRLTEVPTKSSAKKLFDAVKVVEPLRAMAYTNDPRIEIGFCESTTDAKSVQAALAVTGLTGEVIPQQQFTPTPTQGATTTP
jgi:hypothetical protein